MKIIKNNVIQNIKNIELFGDSIFKGIQVDPASHRYHVDNQIGIEEIGKANALSITNFSKFGCTIKKGYENIMKHLAGSKPCDVIIMDFGGNDCDFDWKEIAERPNEEHQPKTPLNVFVETYHKIIKVLKEKGITPVLTTLPPLSPQRFFDWFCKGLNKKNVMKWLGDINVIYRFQELYSRTVEKIAREEDVPLVDLRGAFLQHKHLNDLLCEDGIHPNTKGQKIITSAFMEFIKSFAVTGKLGLA